MAVLSKSEKIGGYTVQNLIKANHYTETYRVVDGDNRPFFLKLFILNNLPSKLMNEGTQTVREIEYCRQLKHRNIVSHVSDGTLERESGSYQYYLTDYFSGPVLADRLATGGPMSEEEALGVFRAILSGLQYMHSQATPLCHNDITPANIVLNDAMNGEAVIIDLGHTCTPCAGIAEFDTNDLDVLYHAKETMVGIFDQQVFARLDGIADKAGPYRDAQLVYAMRNLGPKFICLGIDKPERTAVGLNKGTAKVGHQHQKAIHLAFGGNPRHVGEQ